MERADLFIGVPELIVLSPLLILFGWYISRRLRRGDLKAGSSAYRSAGVGFLVGGAVGLLTRPSVPLLGQLPFDTVLSRGAGLSGIDILLKSTAEASFNQMLVVGVIGAVAGAALGRYFGQQRIAAGLPQLSHQARRPATTVSVDTSDAGNQLANSPTPFCMACGAKLPDAATFCPKCGARRGGAVS